MVHKPEARKTKTPAKKAPAKRGVSAVGARPKAKRVQSKTKKLPGAPVDLVQARADFVRYYIEQDFQNATGAYHRAYPNANEATAAVESSRLLKDPKVQEALSEELIAVIAEKRRPLEKRILDTWLVRAFYDPTVILDLKGQLKITEKELRKLGLHVCIDSIAKKLNNRGQSYLEYKLADRDKALDMLQRYIAMIREPDKNLNVNVGGGVLRVKETMAPEEWAAAAVAQQEAVIASSGAKS
jgi:hypothetical protein